ncbi:hypothetical protein [Roseateles sp.]|uniref:hypothetical protein n=1 Tax=Roseateles sp. TaxID=1971397 RepID=UPI00286A6225|nr:hypothetical protein [Roseateles sp.]
MDSNTLDASMAGIKSAWGPLSTEVVAACREQLEALLKAPAAEAWLAALHREGPANKELHRDPEHGFVLLAHTEPAGLYRPPHDHGRAWVIYAVQQGAIEMGTYARLAQPDGSARLVKRGSTLLRPGQVQAYLPGDIHDTRCVTGPALLFRFTERDLKKEDQEARRLTRYVERDGGWTAGQP